jgi:hypothetical protein
MSPWSVDAENIVQHAISLAEAFEFDKLLEYFELRSHIAAVCQDPQQRLLPSCLREEGNWIVHNQIPVAWEIRSAKSGWKVIEFLVKCGLGKNDVFWTAAKYGDVDVLEAACARKWHEEPSVDVFSDGTLDGMFRWNVPISLPYPPGGYISPHTAYLTILEAAAVGGNALEVFKWLARSRDTYFPEYAQVPQKGDELIFRMDKFCLVFTVVLRNEDIDAAAYIMDMPDALGLVYNGTEREYVIDSAKAVAIKSLNFLCDRYGLEKVTKYVREGLHDDDQDPAYRIDDLDPEDYDEIETWLNDVSPEPKVSATKEHLMKAMETLDEHAQQLPTGAYLKIVNELQEIYKNQK